jgi:hypothetical protein
MDFPLALPVRCSEHGKRNWGRCLGVAYDPLGAAANSRSRSASPLTGRKRAAVLATVKVRPGEVRVCGTAGATADLDGVCARRPSGRQVGAKERLLDRTKERIGSSPYADFSSDDT